MPLVEIFCTLHNTPRGKPNCDTFWLSSTIMVLLKITIIEVINTSVPE